MCVPASPASLFCLGTLPQGEPASQPISASDNFPLRNLSHFVAIISRAHFVWRRRTAGLAENVLWCLELSYPPALVLCETISTVSEFWRFHSIYHNEYYISNDAVLALSLSITINELISVSLSFSLLKSSSSSESLQRRYSTSSHWPSFNLPWRASFVSHCFFVFVFFIRD